MKTKVIRQSDLTSDCWAVQLWGLSACEDCEYVDTEDCGGQAIREALLTEGQCDKVGVDGLEDQDETE